jgi:hypothetical protein
MKPICPHNLRRTFYVKNKSIMVEMHGQPDSADQMQLSIGGTISFPQGFARRGFRVRGREGSSATSESIRPKPFSSLYSAKPNGRII